MDKHDEVARELIYPYWPTMTAAKNRHLTLKFASALRQVAQEKERETLERSIEAVRGKLLQINPELRGPRDAAYNSAINDAIEALRALSPTPTEDVSTPTELVDVSTPGELIDLDRAIIATSAEADFAKGTWTFEPKGEWSVGAGDYFLIPVKP